MKLGYGRVSSDDQKLLLQLDAFEREGVEKVFVEKVTGTSSTWSRQVFDEMLEFARPGDAIVVWKLDRLGRSLIDLVSTTMELKRRELHFVSTTEKFDTTTPTGQFIFHMFAALAELEVSRLKERTKAGLESARARGRVGGRPKVLSKERRRAIAAYVSANPDESIANVCSEFEISRSSYYRHVHPLIGEKGESP